MNNQDNQYYDNNESKDGSSNRGPNKNKKNHKKNNQITGGISIEVKSVNDQDNQNIQNFKTGMNRNSYRNYQKTQNDEYNSNSNIRKIAKRT